MIGALVHFAAGALGALIVFLIRARLSGEKGFSLPAAPVVVGIACASLSHFLSPWATPAILLLYILASADELRQDLADAKAAAENKSRGKT